MIAGLAGHPDTRQTCGCFRRRATQIDSPSVLRLSTSHTKTPAAGISLGLIINLADHEIVIAAGDIGDLKIAAGVGRGGSPCALEA